MTTTSKMKRARLERVGYHEAGHAVAAHHLRIRVREVTIVPSGEYDGRVTHRTPRGFLERLSVGGVSNDRVEAHAIVLLAGPQAEKKFAGRYSHIGARHDYRAAFAMLGTYAGSDDEVNAWMRLQAVRTKALVAAHWADIEAVAAILLERRTIKGSELAEIVGANLGGTANLAAS